MENFKLGEGDTHSPLYEKPIATEVIFEGKVITVRRDTVRHPSGAQVIREVAEHPGGVTVCPILPDGRIVFVEQWRYPLKRTLLELPAGKLDWENGKPEDPLAAIQRELWEETGYEADFWEEVISIYTAPGFCDERLWLFKATQLKNGHKTHQPSDHEWLNVVLLTPEEAMQKVRSGEIMDAKTVCLLGLCFPGF